MAEALGGVAGVVGVTLGGSRARGDAGPDSDVDLGVYYRGAKPTARGDVAQVAGCLYRVVGCLAQSVHAGARRWVTNEKGAVRAAAALPGAPADFEARVATLLGDLGRTPAELARSVTVATALRAEVGQNGGQGTAGQSPEGSG